MSITREIDVVAPNGDVKTYISWKDRMLDIYITGFLFFKYKLKEDNIISHDILLDLGNHLLFDIIPEVDTNLALELGEHMIKLTFIYGPEYKFIYVDGGD